MRRFAEKLTTGDCTTSVSYLVTNLLNYRTRKVRTHHCSKSDPKHNQITECPTHPTRISGRPPRIRHHCRPRYGNWATTTPNRRKPAGLKCQAAEKSP